MSRRQWRFFAGVRHNARFQTESSADATLAKHRYGVATGPRSRRRHSGLSPARWRALAIRCRAAAQPSALAALGPMQSPCRAPRWLVESPLDDATMESTHLPFQRIAWHAPMMSGVSNRESTYEAPSWPNVATPATPCTLPSARPGGSSAVLAHLPCAQSAHRLWRLLFAAAQVFCGAGVDSRAAVGLVHAVEAGQDVVCGAA